MSRHPISNVFSSLILLFSLVWSGLIHTEFTASQPSHRESQSSTLFFRGKPGGVKSRS